MGTPKGIRIIMIIGEVKGIIESQKATGPLGLLITKLLMSKANTSGIVMGNMNCCVSASLSTAEPTAANNAAYSNIRIRNKK